jgi:hypothetical protein
MYMRRFQATFAAVVVMASITAPAAGADPGWWVCPPGTMGHEYCEHHHHHHHHHHHQDPPEPFFGRYHSDA